LAVILLVLMALLLLLILGLIIFRPRPKTEQLALTFSNKSNIANRYKVRAEDPLGGLEFQFALQGALLPVATATPAPNGYPVAGRTDMGVSAPPAGDAASTGPVAVAGTATAGAGPESSGMGAVSPSQALGQTQKKLGCIANAIMPFTTLLSVLTPLMPGALATPVQNWISQVQGVQSTAAGAVSRTKTQVDSTQSAVAGVGQQMSTMTPAATQTEAAPIPAPAATATVSAASSVPAAGQGRFYPSVASAYQPGQAAQPAGIPWAVTPPLDPGGTLTIDVLITPINPNKSKEYVFQVISVLANQTELPPLVEEGTIEVKKPFWLNRLARVALYLFLAALIVASTALISLWLLQISLFDLPLLEHWAWWR
jgi:hypothetical protein